MFVIPAYFVCCVALVSLLLCAKFVGVKQNTVPSYTTIVFLCVSNVQIYTRSKYTNSTEQYNRIMREFIYGEIMFTIFGMSVLILLRLGDCSNGKFLTWKLAFRGYCNCTQFTRILFSNKLDESQELISFIIRICEFFCAI